MTYPDPYVRNTPGERKFRTTGDKRESQRQESGMKCWLLEGGPRPTTATVTQARVRADAGTQSQAQLPTHGGQECLWAPGERMEQIARSAPRRLCTLPALKHCQEAGRWPAQKDCLETCARARLHNFCRLKKKRAKKLEICSAVWVGCLAFPGCWKDALRPVVLCRCPAAGLRRAGRSRFGTSQRGV